MWSRLGAMATRGGWGGGYARGFGRGSPARGGGRHPSHLKGREIGLYYKSQYKSGDGGRHPSHLKGKEIGLYYKNRGLQKKKQREKAEVLKPRIIICSCY